MGKKKRLTWEQSSQVDKIMKDNKPAKVKEVNRYSFWESCVQEYLDRDAEKWRKKNEHN